MEVLNDNVAMLSNHEVYSLLQDIENDRNGQRKPNKSQKALATISYSAIKFLENTPCKDYSSEIIADFISKLAPYKLTKAEKLQLLNQRPRSAVEIQLLIEESEERMTEEQIDSLLELIATCLPGDEAQQPEEEEGEVDEQEEQMDDDQ